MIERIVDVDVDRDTIGQLPGEIATHPRAGHDRLGQAVRSQAIRPVDTDT